MPKSFQMQLYGTSGSMSQQTINGVSTQQFTNSTHQITVYQDLTYKIVPTGNTQNAIPNPNSLLSFSNGTHELRFYGDGRVTLNILSTSTSAPFTFPAFSTFAPFPTFSLPAFPTFSFPAFPTFAPFNFNWGNSQ